MKLNFKIYLGVFILALGALIYSDSLYNSFHFDDFPSIVNNTVIRNIYDLHQIWSFWPTRFVTYLSFALNYHWGGLSVAGFHLASVLIHLTNALLVWRLVLLISNRDAWISFFTALIFLTHPLQTQPVNYLVQRAVLLAAFFYLSALILYIKANLAWEAKISLKTGRVYYAGSVICAALSVLSKENAVSLPLMICLFQWLFLSEGKTSSWKKTIPFFLVVLIMPLAWFPMVLAGIKTSTEGFAQGMSASQYTLTQGKVILTYLKVLLLPFHQRVEYDLALAKSLGDISVIGSYLILVLILGVAFISRNRFKLVSFGIFWFFITLMPESSFWPITDLIFEHRVYLPLAGFSLFLVSALFYIFQTRKTFVAIMILALLTAGYSILTYQRNKIWKNEFTLWDDAVHQSPRSARAYLNRGSAYQSRGDLDHALEDYNMVIGLGPIDAITLSNRGLIFEQKGRYDLALANYNLSIKIDPNYMGSYINRGRLYRLEGKLDNAIADYTKVLAMQPDNRATLGDRAAVFFQKKDYDNSWKDVHRLQAIGSGIKAEYLQALKSASARER